MRAPIHDKSCNGLHVLHWKALLKLNYDTDSGVICKLTAQLIILCSKLKSHEKAKDVPKQAIEII